MPLSNKTHRTPRSLLENPIISVLAHGLNEVVIQNSLAQNATGYEVRIGTIPGLWQPAGIFAADSEIVIRGLVTGLDYYLAVRALGANGVSAWSDAVVYKSE